MTEQNDQEKIVELKNGKFEEKKQNLMGHMNEENVELKVNIKKLVENDERMMSKMIEQNEKLGIKRKLMNSEQNPVEKLPKSLIYLRELPAELVNELFATMPLKKAFGLLAKMPNGLLARNVRKMIESIKLAMKANKWNTEECGPIMTFSQDGLVVGNGTSYVSASTVRAILPIIPYNLRSPNKLQISFYFEVKILKLNSGIGFLIGFCTREFPLSGRAIPYFENTIGIYEKNGICIERSYIKLENGNGKFGKGDLVGIGIIHSPAKMYCFCTWNGQLLGKAELPEKYSTLELFPAIGLNFQDRGKSIRANFGNEEWHFNQFNKLL